MSSSALSARCSADVRLKLETLQPTGSFKVRGAANKLLRLTEVERQRGVVAVSTGNHGRAVAYIAQRLGLTATVCVSEHVPANKLTAIRDLGARLIVGGESQDAAEVTARELAAGGMTLVHPFDDAAIIAGQGTIGLELLEDMPELTTLLVPLSGGGLIAGIALALKRANPSIRVVGVSMEAGAAMIESLRADKPVALAEARTLADSLQGGIGLDNRFTFSLVRDFVDETVKVSEGEINHALAFALKHEGLVLEGAAAVGVAALLSGRVTPDGPTTVVLSGRNIAPETLYGLLAEETS